MKKAHSIYLHYGLKNISCSRYNYLCYHFTLLTYYFNVSVCVRMFHRVSECSNFSKHQFFIEDFVFLPLYTAKKTLSSFAYLVKDFQGIKRISKVRQNLLKNLLRVFCLNFLTYQTYTLT